MLSPSQAALYRRMTLGDEAQLTAVFSGVEDVSEAIDERMTALVRLAALIAIDADAPAYQREVRHALDAGATPEQLTAVLLALARVTGSAVIMSAAPKLALALGYDVDAGLEDAEAREYAP
jgi:alkylhydroperoxidase/carboxymuconolactone decarboxylase family protein YurZ